MRRHGADQVGVVTHEQYREVLQEEGVAFLDGGPCPFAARSATPEGRALDAGAAAAPGQPSALEAFMGMLTSAWFEAGRAALAVAGADVAVLATTSAGFVYPSICACPLSSPLAPRPSA